VAFSVHVVGEAADSSQDALFRKSLSPIARQACEIVDRIREEEIKTIWTPQLEDSIAHKMENLTVFPGMDQYPVAPSDLKSK
jgi:adenosine deaminase CECR1